MIDEESKPAADNPPLRIELGSNIGVPGGAGAARLNTALEDPLTPEETAKFEALLGPKSEIAAPAPKEGTAPVVLTCEDDPFMRQVFAQLVGKLGCDAYEVTNGGDALKTVAAQQIDLLILDIKLPGLDGFGVLRAIRSFLGYNKPDIMVVSVLSAMEDEIAALNLGANDYLRKPFKQPLATAHIKALLRSCAGAPQAPNPERT